MNLKITRDSHILLFIFSLFFNTSKTLIQIFLDIPKLIFILHIDFLKKKTYFKINLEKFTTIFSS